MGMPTAGWAEGLNAGVDGFIGGVSAGQRELEREVELQRQRDLLKQQEDQYQYEQGLRPLKEQMLHQQVQQGANQLQIQQNELGLAPLKQQAAQIGVDKAQGALDDQKTRETFGYAYQLYHGAGDTSGFQKAFNTLQPGGLSIDIKPNKDGSQYTVNFTSPNHNGKVVLDKQHMDAFIGGYAADPTKMMSSVLDQASKMKGRYHIENGMKIDTVTGEVSPAGDGKGTGLPAGGHVSSQVQYLKYVADNVYGGDVGKAFQSIQQGKQKGDKEYRRELASKLIAAEPWADTKDIMAQVDEVMKSTADDAKAAQGMPSAKATGQGPGSAPGALPQNKALDALPIPPDAPKGARWGFMPDGSKGLVIYNPQDGKYHRWAPPADGGPSQSQLGQLPPLQSPQVQQMQDQITAEQQQAGDQMGSRFGMAPGAAPQARGQLYQQALAAHDKALKIINAGRVPDPETLQLALQGAQGAGRTQDLKQLMQAAQDAIVYARRQGRTDLERAYTQVLQAFGQNFDAGRPAAAGLSPPGQADAGSGLPGTGAMPGSLHLNPSLAPRVPAGAPRPLAPGEWIDNPDGSWSSEVTATVTDPSLNGGKPTVIPTLWLIDGRPTRVSEDQAVALAKRSGLRFRGFRDMKAAERYANDREAKWQSVRPQEASTVAPLWQ